MEFFDFHHHDLHKKSGIYNLKFGEDLPQSKFSAGIHPDSITGNYEDHFLWLKEISKLENCLAIGECGLDSLISVEEKLQEEIFERQILWANEIRKPIIIHCVRKFDRLPYFKKISKVPMIVHGFNKRKTIGDFLQSEGFYLSFGQSLLYNVNLQDYLKTFPPEKIFLETDSADFIIEELYRKAASLKNMEVEKLIEVIKSNLKRIQISI